ncbi:MAG: ABC transporter ATP-binding protein [Gemmatimonadales bacterium]|nr:MAG: ABC transporter ATP-binding protein [Gemmatimonadales bacterium]
MASARGARPPVPPPPGEAPPVLEARELERTFGPVRAVDGVTFSLESGELLTILGPNGAGKSTLLGLLSGALRPTAGTLLVDGEPVVSGAVEWRSRLGVLSHRSFLYGALTARENLRFWGKLHGIPHREARLEARIREVGLQADADRSVRGFSRGMRQRLALARTLLHDPTLVLLDEPFTGLDLHAAGLLREVLEGLRDGRRTVVLVTHQIGEGLALADRVAIQARGRFVFLGSRGEIPAGEEEAFYRARVARPGESVP